MLPHRPRRGPRPASSSPLLAGCVILCAALPLGCDATDGERVAVAVRVRAEGAVPASVRQVEAWLRTPADDDFELYRRALTDVAALEAGVELRSRQDPTVPQGALFVRALLLTAEGEPLGEEQRVTTLRRNTDIELVIDFEALTDGGVEASTAENP